MVKIKRTFPAPSSLAEEAKKANGSYSQQDVIEQLKKDFHDKCYICEMKALQDPQVEHLLPHKEGKYKDRKFDWENLFWSCGHCNGVKNQRKYDDGILDCCKEDPELLITYELLENTVRVEADHVGGDRSALTAELINEVFNIRNTGMRVIKSDMRLKELQKEMNVLYDQLEKYKRNPNSKVLIRTLRALLKRESAFAGFKRCYIRKHLSEFPGLYEYIA